MLSPEALRNQDLNRLPHQFFARVPKQPLRLRVDQDDLALSIDDDNGIGCGFQQTPELLFGALALRDVANSSGDQGCLLRLERAEAHFHGKLRPILALTVEFRPLTHGANPRIVEEPRPVRRMSPTKTCRDKSFHSLAK